MTDPSTAIASPKDNPTLAYAVYHMLLRYTRGRLYSHVFGPLDCSKPHKGQTSSNNGTLTTTTITSNGRPSFQ